MIYVCQERTEQLIKEAADLGFYHSDGWNKDYSKLQILTVKELLAGKGVDMSPNLQTFKQAEKIGNDSSDQGQLGFE